jgi:hypothetical protein
VLLHQHERGGGESKKAKRNIEKLVDEVTTTSQESTAERKNSIDVR